MKFFNGKAINSKSINNHEFEKDLMNSIGKNQKPMKRH